MPLDPIHQWISSTARSLSDGQNQPYLIVLQHSMLQRHVMAQETTDKQVYERARVRTPAENAQRDFSGTLWLRHLANEFLKTAKGLVWVQTTGAVPMDASDSSVTILNAASNPFAWDEEQQEQETVLTLENLQSLAAAIQNQVDQKKRPIMIESLTPITMRHGFRQTLKFLRLVQKCNTPLVVPILIETLSSVQHQALEDMAQAVLYLQGGDMTMIRQGVRERGNVIREVIPFQVCTNNVNGTMSIEIITQEGNTEEDETLVSTVTTNVKSDDVKTSLRSGKVKLELQDDGVVLSKEEANRPQIYIQENDPEFHDMDEEDPDDDLDI